MFKYQVIDLKNFTKKVQYYPEEFKLVTMRGVIEGSYTVTDSELTQI